MPLERRDAADALDAIAELLELRGDNPFRVRAFANGARTVRGLTDFDERLAAGTLTKVKGIGKGLVAEIDALAETGASPLLEELRAAVPPGLLALRRVPGLGPKKARTLHEDLGLQSLAELEYACRENRLRALKGFGAKTQARVLEALQSMKRHAGKLRRDDCLALEGLADGAARALGGRAFAAGAFRRGETLSDGIDLVVTARAHEEALEAVLAALPVEEVVARGRGGVARARLTVGAEARLVSGPPGALGLLLAAATGPREHVRALGRIRAENGAVGDPIHCPDEEVLYADLGIPFVPPEQRRDGSEIEAARAGRLPPLVERSAVRGFVHAHTTHSDGSGSVAEMLDAARSAGLSWLGLSDHSPTASYAGGLTVERLRAQQAEIDAEAGRRPDLAVLKGTESDILADGGLDYPEEVLAGFDFVVASVHSQFRMPGEEMTRRVLAAVRNRHTSVLGHPTGRLLLGREGFALDVPAVLRACAGEGVAVELNAHPARLDLDPEWMPLAMELGVMISIGPDAHEVEGFGDLDHGVAVARHAGLPPERVLNTRDADGVRAFFAERRR
jgi:DNA polymerase (family 10)